ncbi:family 43 glycosylhydrolase [Bifidobacterium sp. 82T24]|uniref:family 43 glycosylhydrolase n=1 Tax=Bifidobacterium pluvialisilvae TaxID=2834436 RepID=UPI001C5599C9|nr:family 43 glycosylhydrolase [Bifidobacterium pluvialisilvae]MBW3088587.1 family 43 glycosylhydrolase [Bifidobacterium pluvialisilvae]
MGKWKKVVAAIAALPMTFAGLAIGAGTAAAADATTAPTPIASYPLTADANDVSGNDFNGTAQSGVTFNATDGATLTGGKATTAGTDAITLPNDIGAKVKAGNAVTISAWIKNTTTRTNTAALYLGEAPASNNMPTHYWLLNPSNPSGNYKSVITNATNAGAPYNTEVGGSSTSTADVTGKWANYTTVISPTTITSYLNGEQIQTVARSQSMADWTGDINAYIGRSNYTGDKTWGGSVQDLRFYGEALTADQVSSVFADAQTDATKQTVAEAAADALDLGIKGNVTSDITLPTAGSYGATVTWASNNEAVISSAGKVTPAAADTAVMLTATVTVDGKTATKTFELTVPAKITEPSQVGDKLLVDYQLTNGTKLPTSLYGATIAWTATGDGAKLVAADGTVTGADGDAEKTVDLTATIALDGKTATKTFKAVRIMPKNAETIASYTRDHSINGGARVGDALHLALNDGTKYTALNTNYGVAFAEAKITVGAKNNAGYPTQTTDIRGLVDPYLFPMKDGKYAYVAAFTDVNGNRVDGGQIAFSTSSDLTAWSGKPNEDERGDMVKVTDDATVFDAGSITAGYDAAADDYRISWKVNGVDKYVTTTDFKTFSDVKNGSGFARTKADLSGVANAVSANTMAVTKSVAATLSEKLGRVHNTGVEQPATITVKKGFDLAKLKEQISGGVEQKDGTLSKGKTLKAEYSDGSTFDFRVNWNEDQLNKLSTDETGETTIEGTAIQQNYSEQFPMMSNRADPNIVYYKGKYYAMGTSDAGGMRTLFIRSSDTLAGLKDQKAGVVADGGYKVEGQDVYLFGDNDGLGHKGYHWAPELHVINGKLYCFYATVPDKAYGGPNWVGTAPVAYVMELKDGGDPTKTADWIEHRVQRQLADGSLDNLSNLGLTIDMTYFEVGDKAYIAWSQGDEERAGAKANVSIAEVNPDKPWVALTTPQRIMRPEWGWELDGVNEGPNVLVSGGKVYMVFSAQLVTPQYATGMLVANVGDDLTKASSWTKSNYPWLHNGTFAGQYGLGHNSYFADPYGDVYNVYHAMTNGSRNTARSAGVVPVHFRADGTPIIDMTTTEELQKEYSAANYVKLTIKVVDDAVSSDATLKSLKVAGVGVDMAKAASADGASLEVADPSAVTADDVVAEANDANAGKPVVTVADGKVTVVVTAQDGTTKKTYTVNLVKKTEPVEPSKPTLAITGENVKDGELAMKVGASEKLTATYTADGDVAGKAIEWSLSDPAVAALEKKASSDAAEAGVGTNSQTLVALKAGKTTVTAKVGDDTVATIEVTVSDDAVTPNPNPSDKPGAGTGDESTNGNTTDKVTGTTSDNAAKPNAVAKPFGSLSRTGAAVGAVALAAVALAGAGVVLTLRRRRA